MKIFEKHTRREYNLEDRIEKLENSLREGQLLNNFGPKNSNQIVQEYLLNNSQKKLNSSICKEIHFNTSWFVKWTNEIKEEYRLHRKLWEFAYIIQALYERGMIKNGKKGLGFAVGTEPLPAIFARHGCFITATDIEPEVGEQKGWANQDQLCY